ncbi:ABC transporter substrate-binding protein [Pseudomonas oryzihabitans]|uniref:MlaC/ttg2D family ABC transporter substrate-binding protein n=1 Tax=Pseudomonas oryzihabitans TaxID=47885 RepID=UPI0028951A01|nr:ABC transporter substrate-binding protein [Pseudomonas oryzihabitans]MDT3718538.1 ABC transporter substrate-binding protein [Pseudomonas oryzihabitans]
MLKLIRHGVIAILALLPLVSQAAPSAHDVIQQTTNTLLSDLQANRDKYRSNPEAFYESLNGILGPVVDAEGISRSIMTVRYSRGATPEQMARFQENFKRSLMQFYGNALLEYNNQGIRVLPEGPSDGPDRTSVGMEVKGNNGAVYPVQYSMVKQGDDWKVRNVIINGLNLGKLFRDQFAQAMQDNNGDLNKTIDNWAGTVAKAKDSPEAQKAKVGS